MIPDLNFPFVRMMLRMEARGKHGRFTVLAGQRDHDFIGEIYRLFLRYFYLLKISGDYLFQKKTGVSICQERSEL